MDGDGQPVNRPSSMHAAKKRKPGDGGLAFRNRVYKRNQLFAGFV